MPNSFNIIGVDTLTHLRSRCFHLVNITTIQSSSAARPGSDTQPTSDTLIYYIYAAKAAMTPEAVHQMIQSALSAMGLSGNLSSKRYIDSGQITCLELPKTFFLFLHIRILVKFPLLMGQTFPGIGAVSFKKTTWSDVLLVPVNQQQKTPSSLFSFCCPLWKQLIS